MKIAIVGAAGRMGRKLCELAAGTDMEVVSKVDAAEGYDKTFGELPAELKNHISHRARAIQELIRVLNDGLME